jgi:predicted bacteriocin transport accessory protein
MKTCKALLISALIALSGCAPKGSDTITITNPIEMNSEPAIMTVYDWIGEEIADFQEITFMESTRLFSEKGSGILYFGYNDCPWCERAVPVLNEAALETGVTVYYVDIYGPFQPTKAQFEELLGYIESTLIEDDKGEKAFFVPAVIGIKNGEITGSHVSLLSDFTLEDEDSQLSDEQKQKLKDIYLDIIRKTAD